MTTERLDTDRWRLSFDEHEAAFIVSVLAQLGRQYEEDPAKMSPALRAYWTGSISHHPAGAEARTELAEAQELLAESRMELRSQRLELVENWIQEYELAENRDPWQVEVTAADRDEFVAMLNDRRLLLALKLGVTESDMEIDPTQISDEMRRHGIFEIEYLGHFIMTIIGPQIFRP
jgi:hypothetical protein